MKQEKNIRKAVRTILIENNKVVITKYNTEINKDYYDLPGGKIEPNETSEDSSIREFKEETGMTITKQKKIGHSIIEYQDRIFDFEIYLVENYEGKPQNFKENDSMWMDIDKIINEQKKIPTIELLKHLNKSNINLKIICDDNHNILKINNLI